MLSKMKLILVLTSLTFVLSACTTVEDDPLSRAALPLETAEDLDPLLAQMREHNILLLGESTHGTQEFYEWRRIITQRLIDEQDIGFIAVEGDWASLYALHEYVMGITEEDAETILRSFKRWPEWMWGNAEILKLAEWLREHNAQLPQEQRVGFFGMDVYGAEQSLQAVLNAAQNTEQYDEIRLQYSCFAGVREFMDYISLLQQGVVCDEEAEQVFALLQDAPFEIQQHALVVKHAERHFRAMIDPSLDSWNERVYHMHVTLDSLLEQYGRGIVWAHNTHVGDARATSMALQGSVNIGQLLRQDGTATYILGFGTYTGSVRAGLQWDAPGQVMHIPAGMSGSYEKLLSRFDKALFLLEEAPPGLRQQLPHRAIGVVYNPLNERGNYVPTVLADRYDAFIFIRETRAMSPLQ